MHTTLVLNVAGRFRPGIVAELSSVVDDFGANWELSRMTRLEGWFSGLVSLTLPTDRVRSLVEALQGLSSSGLIVKLLEGEPVGEVSGTALEIDLLGNDRPGIVRQLSARLGALGLDVEDITSTRFAAPHSGGLLFHAELVVRAPPEVDLFSIRPAIEAMGHDLQVDISLLDEDEE